MYKAHHLINNPCSVHSATYTDVFRPESTKRVNALNCTIQILVPNKIPDSFELGREAAAEIQTKVSFVNLK